MGCLAGVQSTGLGSRLRIRPGVKGVGLDVRLGWCAVYTPLGRLRVMEGCWYVYGSRSGVGCEHGLSLVVLVWGPLQVCCARFLVAVPLLYYSVEWLSEA